MTKPKNGNDRMNAKLSFVILPTNETNWPKNGAAWNPNRSQNDNRLEFPPGFGIYKPNAGKDTAHDCKAQMDTPRNPAISPTVPENESV